MLDHLSKEPSIQPLVCHRCTVITLWMPLHTGFETVPLCLMFLVLDDHLIPHTSVAGGA